MSSLKHFLSELKRRKVYRVAIVYTVVAVGVWQAADVALPQLGLPDSAVPLVLVLTILGFPVALVLAWAYELRPEEPASALPKAGASSDVASAGSTASGETGSGEGRVTTSVTSGAESVIDARSIAILPFENMSTEEESEYFADGISEELTHVLGRVQRLRVAARTSAFSFKGQRLDAREIGKKLNVAHLVEGSVRRAGSRLRVTAQLIDTAEGYHIWSERFERELDDVFAIQDEIVEAVVESLLEKLDRGEGPSRSAPTLSRTDDLDAYNLYLRGTHELRAWSGPAVLEATRLLEQAIELDPIFAPSHAALADALTMQAIGFHQGPHGRLLERARQAADRAIELDPELPAAHLARALSLLYHDWAFKEARAELEEALRLNPSYADAHRWAEFYWSYVEHNVEAALAALAKAAVLDPFDPRVPMRIATVHYIFGQYGEAERLLRELIEREPESPIARLGLMDTLLRDGRAPEAVEIARAMPIDETAPDVLIAVCLVVLATAADRSLAAELLALLEKRAESGYSAPFWRALGHAAMGDLDTAFELLGEAVGERDAGLLYLSVVPKLSGFQEDPRFVATLRRIGLGHLLPTI